MSDGVVRRVIESGAMSNETHSGPVVCPQCGSEKVTPVRSVPVANVVIEYKCECGMVFRVLHRGLGHDD